MNHAVAAALLFVLALGFLGALGWVAFLLLAALALVVARAARAVRRVFYLAAAWRAGEWSPLTEMRVRWASRRLDSWLDWLMADMTLPHREP